MSVRLTHFVSDKPYLAAVASHFFIDVLNNGRVLLMALLAVSLGLTNAQVGLYLLVYNLGGSLSQPLFGWLADRFGARPLVLGGVAWMITFYSLAALGSEWTAVVAIMAASLGSGAFHPSGTKVASQAAAAIRTRATAVFFMAGQMGLFVGPVLAGFLLGGFGRSGYLALPLLALLALVGGWRWLVDDPHAVYEDDVPLRPAANRSSRPALPRTALAIVVIIFAYNTVSYVAMNFAPKLFTEWGYPPAYVGWIAGLYMLGSAVGGLVGGALADRSGNRPVILMAMLGAVLPLYLYIPAGDLLRFPLLLLAGFFGGMPHSILVLLVQKLLPGRRALASGLALGFMFLSGAVGSYIVGLVADRLTLALALRATAALPLFAAVAALFLPRRSAAGATAQPAPGATP